VEEDIVISRRITPERRGRRFITGIAALGLIAGSMLASGTALAVHDENFQLDGDTSIVAQNGSGTTDWDTLFNADGTNTSAIGGTNDYKNGDFKRDFLSKTGRTGACSFGSGTTFCTADDTTFATGSKDTLNITPGWQCNHDNNVNSKIDIMNAYAVSYIVPSGVDAGDRILYFALEKNVDNGNNNVGFWFLKSDADCSSASGTAPFTGSHADGDVLIVSAFTNGGGVSSITAYRWTGGATGCIDSTPATANCDGLPIASGGDCKANLGGDSICATTNSGPTEENDAITTKWPTANGSTVGTTVVPPDFFEGGINLNEAFETSGGAPRCFNTFIADTRSSQSLTATLFDYARGTLGECTVSMTTAPSSTADRALGSTDAITDTATVTGHAPSGTAPSPTGTVSFYLCSPSDLTTGGVADTDGVCEDSNGTFINDDTTLTAGAGGTATATSDDVQALLTEPGKYCFRAHYAAGATEPNYPGQTAETSNPAAECFTVTANATTSTTQSWLPQDTAHVTADGGATVEGFVVFQLFESTDCSGDPVQTFGADESLTVDSNGDVTTNNTTYYTDNVQVSWIATFTSTNAIGSGDPGPCERSDIANLDNDTTP
jgi:hypothetical protein